MCEIIPAPQSAPLFVIPSRSGRLRLVLKSQFVSVLPDRLQSAGIPQADLFRGHSFRRGIPPGPSLVASQGSLFRSLGIGILMHTSVILKFPYPLGFVCLRVWLLAFRLQSHKLFGWFLVGREVVFVFFFLRLLRAGGGLVLINLSLCQTVCLRVFIFSTVFEEYHK